VQLGADDSLRTAQDRLAQTHAGVVIESGQAIGILTRSDILRIAEVMEAYPRALPRG
jgi:predicted transcriptional regulator